MNEIKKLEHVYFYASILCVIVVLWLCFFIDSYAQETVKRPGSLDKSVEILNALPTIDSISLSNHEQAAEIRTFVPTENMNGFLYIYGVVNDPNGCQDVLNKDTWNLSVYRSSVEGGKDCTSDSRSCYHGDPEGQLTLSNCEGNSDTYISYQWRVPLAHYIDPTDNGEFANDTWRVDMNVGDQSNGNASATRTFEVATLRAVMVDPLVQYGEVTPGNNSITKALTITNTGNDPVDLDIRSIGEMVCEKGTIPAKNIHMSLHDNFAYEKPDIVLSDVDQWLNLSLPKRIGAGLSQKKVYLQLQAPQSQVKGLCKNEITFTATRDR